MVSRTSRSRKEVKEEKSTTRLPSALLLPKTPRTRPRMAAILALGLPSKLCVCVCGGGCDGE